MRLSVAGFMLKYCFRTSEDVIRSILDLEHSFKEARKKTKSFTQTKPQIFENQQDIKKRKQILI
jgi:hypothetical protein